MARKRRHNPKTCIGCRLHGLLLELYPNGPRSSKELQEVLHALAGASADMLQCTDRDGVKTFMTAVMAKVMEYEENRPSIH